MWLSAYAPPAPVPKLPKGLVELMEGLSRDVLKNNPREDDLLQFCADHMKNLLNLRGASEGKKSLSLEQKILKAQDRIRRKAEIRIKKYDEQDKLRSKRSSDGNIINIATSNDKYGAKDIPNEQIVYKSCEDVSEILAKLPDEKMVDKTCEDLSQIQIANRTENDDNLSQIQMANQPENEDNDEQETAQLIETTDEKDTVQLIKATEELNTDKGSHDELVKEKVIESVVHADLKSSKDTETNEFSIEQLNELENTIDTKISNKITLDENDSETTNKEQETVDDVQVIAIHSRNDADDHDDTIFVQAGNETDKMESEENGDVSIVDTGILTSESSSTNAEAEASTNPNLVSSETDNGEASVDVKAGESILVVESSKIDDSTLVAEISEPTQIREPAQTKSDDIILDSDDVNTPVSDETIAEAEVNINSSNLQSENDSKVEDETNVKISGQSIENKGMGENTVERHIESSKAYDTELVSDQGDTTEIESAVLCKSPEIIDEDCLKDNEVCIIAKSNSTEQETGLVPPEQGMGLVSAAEEVLNLKNSFTVDDDDKAVSDFATTENIDINAIARCDSINEDIQDRHKNMDLETAAVTIQKVFRTFMFKSRASTLDEIANEAGSMDVPFPGDDMLANDAINILKTEEEYHNSNLKERSRPLGITRMDTVLQTVNEEKSLSLSDESSLSSAATIIQAYVRGFLVRNRLHSLKAASLGSVVNTDRRSTSLDVNNERNKNKTVLNIHIVPEGGHYLSRDESMAMSLDLPYDNDPPHWGPSSSLNLHPLSERRKQLKREDAIQSISPPSNNSGKLSEDVESIKDMSGNGTEAGSQNVETPATLVNDTDNRSKDCENVDDTSKQGDNIDESSNQDDNIDHATNEPSSGATTPTASITGETVVEVLKDGEENTEVKLQENADYTDVAVIKTNEEDEMDVVTKEDSHNGSIADSDSTSRLVNSGEFHDQVLPTPVMRGDATVAREFKEVIVKYLLWNHSSS